MVESGKMRAGSKGEMQRQILSIVTHDVKMISLIIPNRPSHTPIDPYLLESEVSGNVSARQSHVSAM
jgi:hypothetical protein